MRASAARLAPATTKNTPLQSVPLDVTMVAGSGSIGLEGCIASHARFRSPNSEGVGVTIEDCGAPRSRYRGSPSGVIGYAAALAAVKSASPGRGR